MSTCRIRSRWWSPRTRSVARCCGWSGREYGLTPARDDALAPARDDALTAEHPVTRSHGRGHRMGGQVDIGPGAEADQPEPLAAGEQRAGRRPVHDAPGDEAG